MTERLVLHCLFTDAMGTRAMIRAGGGTVIGCRPVQVIDDEGNPAAGLAVSYDLPVPQPTT